MAINKYIKIQKLNPETEEFEDFYKGYAEINKASGKEYFNAKTKISENTLNFKVRFLKKLEDTIYNFSQYRIIYKNREYDIINVDDKFEKRIKITFVANCITI